jgi:hypothetical protein
MFGPESYKKMIKNLADKGFQASLDWNTPSANNKLLLRHDIDFSVEHAYKLAIIEADLDVRSTFFFMLTSNMYNLMSRRNCDLISDIRDMGHKIAIHFDPTAYSSLESFEVERKVFEGLFTSRLILFQYIDPVPF